ncbi:MAG TPA: TonB-dependent receptor plug domain-containing protein, partial [Croceibacterium sp.]|nr:TonB-dependent receptor plug domain-containing protein [Croceibacterium sp.]
MSIDAALTRLLAGSGYVAHKVGPTAWRIEAIRAVRSPLPSQAHDTVPEAPPGEPILVTASKRRIALADLPIDVSAVSVGTDTPVQSSPAAGTERIASEIEGLSLTASGSGRNRMFLRGVADSPFNGESQSTVAVVLDDARLTYAAPDPDIALVDMERVEVLKGPQGALYGTGALGGIYHLVSHRASLGANALEVTAGGEF